MAVEEEAGRPTWSRQIEFTLAGIGCAVGLGNIWRFPYLCYRSGGGAFLVPYLLMLVVLGIPLLHMELTLGQYLRRGPVLALTKACPLLKGVGMATVAISFIMCTYYNVIITWALYYMFSSFRSELLWENCNNTWNTANCTDRVTNSSSSSTTSQQFFKDTLAISITNSLTSILAGFVIFSAFGYMSHLQNVPVSEIAVDGPGLVFVVYPQAFVTMPVAPLWAVLFFFMLLCLGLDSQHLDMPHIVSIMFLAFFEVVAVCWLYGVKRLSSNLLEMTGKRPSIFFRVCWWVICPVLITVILVFSVIQFKPARYEDYVYPAWAQGVGWLIALASIIWIPLAAVHTLWLLPGSFTERLKKSITPFSLDDDSEQKGVIIISSIVPLSDKAPIQTNL
ncbi:sodium-dependent dopamine transporter-like [Sinocyclocheilus rhinocerous]|uniref:sodium-dependent dopamine transporter-like n=1 Tax=Sinocyclocheilus rhinocerous TaxID=307959 RepID=UPI0007B7CBD2|nr:PREDICTED: sodium-dependent dopamine transporter-like [Sinocyclocheilus rhinocerous]